MKNKLIVIGWLGFKSCYLNVTSEEAIKRWLTSESISAEDEAEARENLAKNEMVSEFEFDDEFNAYDAWKID